MQISDYTRIVELADDWQLKCPIYQQALLSYWLDRNPNRRMQREQICEFFRDHDQTLFVPPVPDIDDVIPDEHATILRRFGEGAHIRNTVLMRMIDGLVRVKNPSFAKFASLHSHNKKLGG